jgi:hypothetical protein
MVATVPVTPIYRQDQGFFLALSAVLAGFTILAFVQWAARGMVAPLTLPWWIHAHGAAMATWLVLLVVQNYLIFAGRHDLHRPLGWIGAGLVAVIAFLGLMTGVQSVALHRVPPFWSDAFLLALATVSVTVFVSLVAAGVALRRKTEWHRRLMIGATIVLLTAAFDRTLPLPLLGAARPFSEGGLQLVVVGTLAVHDWRVRGGIHPATLWIGGAVTVEHLAIATLAAFPTFISLASRISG